MRVLLFTFCFLTLNSAYAVGPLSASLTLNEALNSADGNHPYLQMARANIAANQAQLQLIKSHAGILSYIEGRLRYLEPSPIDFDQTKDDHKIGLVVTKNLYDFGRTSAAVVAQDLTLSSYETVYIDELFKHQLRILSGFFSVLLADMQFIRDNEAMSVAFIRWDRSRMKNELGQVSDVDVLEAHSHYQSVRRNYYTSRSLQRSTRANLANLLNQPGDLPKDLVEPALPIVNRQIAEFEELESEALKNNPSLQALRVQVQSAQKRVEAARAGAMPILKGEVELADYSREGRYNNDWAIGLSVNIPLLDGGSVQAEVAKEQALLYKTKAQLRQQEMLVSQSLLEKWQLLDTLRIQREEAQATLDYRDLALDKSRALYEMEVKADLGDSMTNVSDARLNLAQARYTTALTWAQIDALLGKVLNLD